MKEKLPRMVIDEESPGVIRFVGLPSTGMLAGVRAAQIVEACNTYEAIKTLLDAEEDGIALLHKILQIKQWADAAIKRHKGKGENDG